MTFDTTAADAVLKEDYQPVIREQLNNTNVIDAQIEKNEKDTDGKYAYLALHISRNNGVGARAELAALPTPGSQGYTDERVPMKYTYGTFKVSGPVIAASRTDKGSYLRALDSESKGLVKDVKREENRQDWGTSDGVIATCGTTSSSTTVVLAAATYKSSLRQLTVGDRIDIGTVASPQTIAANRLITAVDTANKTITISGATVSTTGSHFIFRNGAGGVGIEKTGIQSIIAASGSLHNVDPNTYSVWKSYVDSNSGTLRAPTDTLFEKALDEVSMQTGGEVPNLLVTTAGVSRAFAASLKSQKRFVDTVDLKGGFKALSVSAGTNELMFTWDRDCPDGHAFGVSTDHLTQFRMSDWEFMDRDGAVLSRALDGSDAYEAVLYKYRELTTDQRNAHFLVTDLQGDDT